MNTSASPQLLPLDRLHSHPGNPRLVDREHVIEAIIAGLVSGFDPAHALIVRPRPDGDYEILSGHHRKQAGERVGLTEVPCWVRDLDDDDADMLLVTSNAQSELTALEHGLHALRMTEKGKHGKSISAYAEAVGRPRQSVQQEVHAAEVYREVAANAATLVPTDQPRHLAEIHAAPRWFWRALVQAMVGAPETETAKEIKPWTIEQTKATVARFKDVPEKLPEWFSDDTPVNLVRGALRVKDIADMIKLVTGTRAKITNALWQTDEFIAMFDTALREQRPGTVSALTILCNSVINDQAEDKAAAERRRHEEEKAASDAAAQELRGTNRADQQ
jgi:ParB/RepB/Spo0J family partition protein